MSQAADVDDLFKLPPGEFTAARNALVAKLKKSGHEDEAVRVKMLPKPPASAWAVNQVYWRHRKPFDALLAAGETFRKAQAAQLAGKSADLRAPLDARRQALAELSKIAAGVLRDAGYTATPDTMRRINTTLEALATYGSHPEAPPAGRLTHDIDPPGFEALTALVPRGSKSGLKGTEPTRVIPFERKAPEPRKKKLDPKEEAKLQAEERKAQQAAVRAAVQEAERTLRDARKAAAEAEAALKKAAARAKEAERVKAELGKNFEKVSAEADAARQEARHVASEAEDAAQAVADAERALETARRQIT